MGPLDVPAGRIAVVMDPQGAAFSLFQGDLDP
jgi:predicted enzyme related to lactoylglutathione lyase